MITVRIFEKAGILAENKDIGREIRLNEILPALERGEDVILDFEKVESATQSFIHSVISDVLRKHGEQVLDRMLFKSCNEQVKQMIGIVVGYMQDAIEKEERKNGR